MLNTVEDSIKIIYDLDIQIKDLKEAITIEKRNNEIIKLNIKKKELLLEQKID